MSSPPPVAYDPRSRAAGVTAGWQKRSSRHWLAACRAFAETPQILKAAELGGGQDTPFEAAFANLAHSYLRDKAPKLLEYEVGFQLIEKNQENTKAVGVFGFKVGDQWLYAPVFFLNGDLKGHELLYIKNQDLFVPLKDNWLNYLLGRKPSMLGNSVDRNLSNLGHTPPSLHQLTRSPYKYASAAPDLPGWARDFLPVLGRLVTTPVTRMTKYANLATFPEVFRAGGRGSFAWLEKVAEEWPVVYREIDRAFGDEIRAAARDVRRAGSASVVKRAAAAPRAASLADILGRTKRAAGAAATMVRVVLRYDLADGGPDLILDEDERAELGRSGRVVRDSRPDSAVSRAYDSTTSLKLTNPTETNVYDVLVKPDRFERCLVVVAPYGAGGRTSFCTVVSLEGSRRRWLNVHASHVFCRSAFSRQAWNAWFDALPDADDLPVGDRFGGRDRVVLLGRGGQGTCPLAAHESHGDGGIYCVDFDDYAAKSRPFYQDRCFGSHPAIPRSLEDDDRVRRVRFLGRPGSQLRVSGEELWVPDGYKRLSLAGPESTAGCCDGADRSDPGPLEPGDLADVRLALTGSLVPLRLLDGGSDVDVNGRRFAKEAAFRHLVVDWGFRAADADALLAKAASSRSRVSAMVKRAGPFLTESSPGSPGIPEGAVGADPLMGSNTSTRVLDERELRVPDMMADPAAIQKYRPVGPDPSTMQVAQQASQTGQREVFETAALGSLLKTLRQDSMVDRYLGDLTKGMDRKGRIYFQFLWHGEQFEDRYGKQDLPELEDSLRNAFEADGDLILVLKRKAIEPFAEQGNDVDLSSLANQ